MAVYSYDLEPLFAPVKYTGPMFEFNMLELEYGFIYTRAKERWYGDNRVDHIRRV